MIFTAAFCRRFDINPRQKGARTCLRAEWALWQTEGRLKLFSVSRSGSPRAETLHSAPNRSPSAGDEWLQHCPSWRLRKWSRDCRTSQGPQAESRGLCTYQTDPSSSRSAIMYDRRGFPGSWAKTSCSIKSPLARRRRVERGDLCRLFLPSTRQWLAGQALGHHLPPDTLYLGLLGIELGSSGVPGVLCTTYEL